ncbi:MAG: 4-hydroxy-2-oxovalerate aldolase [Pseudomonadota bacterium]|jgi:4-hydroxy-2-oxovalerate aldolase
MRRLLLHDVTLRDGMHALAHQITLEQMVEVARRIDAAGIDLIEVSHGDGLGGGSLNYGFARHDEREYLEAVAAVLTRTRLGVLLLPGIGTVDDLQMAYDAGARNVRVATHSTEADISRQHIEAARGLGMDTVGFLMMAHLTPTARLVQEARKMQSYGAHCVYVVDSAGAMDMADTRERVTALKDALDCQVGFHNHDNLGLGVANTLVAVEAGADRVDASLAGLGAGAGNCKLEVLVAALDRGRERLGVEIGAALYPLIDAADQVVRPMMQRPVQIDGRALVLGWAGVYSSFLIHAERAAERFGVDARDILVELGRRRMVGGQEDMIVDVALELAERARTAGSPR